MFRPAHLLVLPALTACTAPDIGPEVALFATAVGEVTAPARTILQADRDAAHEAQIAARIARGEPVFTLSPGCQHIGADIGAGHTCRPDAVFPPDDSVLQLALAVEVLDALDAYLAALELLIGTKTPAGIAAGVPKLTGELQALGQAAGDPGLAAATERLNRHAGAILLATGMAAEGARHRALRRTVREADPTVGDAVASLIAVLEKTGRSSLLPRYRALAQAEDAMEAARISGDRARYARAVVAFRTAAGAFDTESRTSLAGRLAAVRSTHAALAERLAAGATLAEISAFVAELAALRAAIDAAKG